MEVCSPSPLEYRLQCTRTGVMHVCTPASDSRWTVAGSGLSLKPVAVASLLSVKYEVFRPLGLTGSRICNETCMHAFSQLGACQLHTSTEPLLAAIANIASVKNSIQRQGRGPGAGGKEQHAAFWLQERADQPNLGSSPERSNCATKCCAVLYVWRGRQNCA
eukprot:1143362-Pelagomonas_calceolata.AAC.4